MSTDMNTHPYVNGCLVHGTRCLAPRDPGAAWAAAVALVWPAPNSPQQSVGPLARWLSDSAARWPHLNQQTCTDRKGAQA